MATKYKNIGGNHTQTNGDVVPTGGVFIDPDDTLDKKFAAKFEVIERGIDADDATSEDQPEAGVDVTDDFPTAKAAGLTVIKAGKTWDVYDEDREPINDKPLRKKDVEAIIDEYSKE